MQPLYSQDSIPKVLRDASDWYITFSGDPLINGAFHGGPDFNWFRAFLYLEVYARSTAIPVTARKLTLVSRVFQLPLFFVAARALWLGPPKLQLYYPLMLAYSASSCTTTFGCLAVLWTSTGLTQFQMCLLLGSYIPFFLVPFGMAIDMTTRLTKAQRIKTFKGE